MLEWKSIGTLGTHGEFIENNKQTPAAKECMKEARKDVNLVHKHLNAAHDIVQDMNTTNKCEAAKSAW